MATAGQSPAPLAQPKVRELSQTVTSLRRKLDRLENSSSLLQQDPDIVLTGLKALEVKVTELKGRVSRQQNNYRSGDPSPEDVSQLLVRTQRLARKVVAEQTLKNRNAPAGLISQGSASTSLQSLESPFVSSSAMGRFLEESLAQHRRQKQASSRVDVRLPPTPKLVVVEDEQEEEDFTDGKSAEDRLQQQQHKEEQDELAAYERASHLRRRHRESDSAGNHVQDDEKEASARSEKANTDSQQTSTKPQASAGAAAAPAPILSSDRSTQEALSHELLRMASSLKSQSISFSSALERDRKLLENADEKLLANLDVMTRTRGRLGEYAHKARGMGWFTLATIAVVVATWVVMFVIIRLT